MAPGPEEPIADAEAAAKPRRGIGRRLIIGGVLMLAVLGAAGWYFSGPAVPPADRLKEALALLDEGNDRSARKIAAALESEKHRDVDFPGGIEFIMGMTAFHEVESWDVDSREPRYLIALNHLRDAEKLAVIAERRPEWAYAMGVSLFYTGSPDRALPFLAESVQTYAKGRTTAALLAAEASQFRQTEVDSQNALEFIKLAMLDLQEKLNETRNATPVDELALESAQNRHDAACLLRAAIEMRLGMTAAAEKTLAQIPDASRDAPGTSVLRAQALMARGDYSLAMQLLKKHVDSDIIDRTYPAQAMYLLGVCAENQGLLDEAVTYFRRTTDRYEKSHEGVAARLATAECLRKLGRTEEALLTYGEFIRGVRSAEQFRNRWLSIRRVQDILATAWQGWVEQEFYPQAIALAEMLRSVLPADRAAELVAVAHMRWADQLETEVRKLPYDQKKERIEEVRARRRASGRAYSVLATNRKVREAYLDALWISGDQLFLGHDYTGAATQFTQYIDSQAPTRVPSALVLRGRCQASSGDLPAAIADFRAAIRRYPQDPASFEAEYRLGQAYFEQQDLAAAEETWRHIIASENLAPTAWEWQHSLYSLGKLLFDSAELALFNLNINPETAPGTNNPGRVAQYARFEEAGALFSEYLDRYPNSPESLEVRFYRAKSFQKSAAAIQEKLDAAETDNARVEYRKQIVEKLAAATGDFQALETALNKLRSEEKLDLLGNSLLRGCWFELANCKFHLELYAEAISAYTEYITRYSTESDSLAALLQIAICYNRMNKTSEALSTYAQARIFLNQLPDTAFQGSAATLSRNEWRNWIDTEEAYVRSKTQSTGPDRTGTAESL